MPLSQITKLMLFSGGQTPAQAYAQRVLATSPLRYNRLNATSGTSIIDSSGNGYTGTYSGVALADTPSPFLGDRAPFWDGVNDTGNLYSASFATALNLDEFTIMLWIKVNSSSIWTDGANHRAIHLERNGTNRILIGKTTTNNQFLLQRVGGGTTKTVLETSAPTDWTSYALSCSVAGGGLLGAGELKAYKNGVQIGSTQTANIASTGSGLDSSVTSLGSQGTLGAYWHGWLSHLIIWNRPIDAAILALMTP